MLDTPACHMDSVLLKTFFLMLAWSHMPSCNIPAGFEIRVKCVQHATALWSQASSSSNSYLYLIAFSIAGGPGSFSPSAHTGAS